MTKHFTKIQNCFKILVLIFFLIIFGIPVIATSIQGGFQSFTFQKGMQTEYPFAVGEAEHINVTIGTDIPNGSKYVTLIDPDPNGGPRSVKVKFDLYDDLPPGKYYVMVNAIEVLDSQGTIAARAGVRARVTMLVLFKGKYIEWGATADNINVNGTADIQFRVTSLGTDTINALKGTATIFDEQGKELGTVYSDTQSLESDKVVILHAYFNTTGLDKGNYLFNATLDWDGTIEKPQPGTFRIGSLFVYVRDYTKEFIIGALNLFQVTLESDWSGTIKDVYAEITTPNKVIKTSPVDLETFRKNTVETYWDTSGLEKGDYPVTIKVKYAGKETVDQGIVSINKTGQGVEPPKTENFVSKLSTTTIILMVIILALIVNFVIFFVMWRKKK